MYLGVYSDSISLWELVVLSYQFVLKQMTFLRVCINLYDSPIIWVCVTRTDGYRPKRVTYLAAAGKYL